MHSEAVTVLMTIVGFVYFTIGVIVAAAYSWDDKEIVIPAFSLVALLWPVWFWLEFVFRAAEWLHTKLQD